MNLNNWVEFRNWKYYLISEKIVLFIKNEINLIIIILFFFFEVKKKSILGTITITTTTIINTLL